MIENVNVKIPFNKFTFIQSLFTDENKTLKIKKSVNNEIKFVPIRERTSISHR